MTQTSATERNEHRPFCPKFHSRPMRWFEWLIFVFSRGWLNIQMEWKVTSAPCQVNFSEWIFSRPIFACQCRSHEHHKGTGCIKATMSGEASPPNEWAEEERNWTRGWIRNNEAPHRCRPNWKESFLSQRISHIFGIWYAATEKISGILRNVMNARAR